MTREQRRFRVGDAPEVGDTPARVPVANSSHSSPRRARRCRTPLAHALAATGDQWTLLIVLQLASGPARLARLQESLPGISTGVLDRHLHEMAALGLLSRERFREAPPRVEVNLTDSGRELLPIAGALARWGMRHMWLEPRGIDRVDIQTCLGLLPVLLEETPIPDATLEVLLTPARAHLPLAFRAQGGQLRAVGQLAGAVTARVEGNDKAWIAALGPASDYKLLVLAGDKRLVRGVLDALPRGGGSQAGK